MTRIEKTRLPAAGGVELAAIIDWPDDDPWAFALFAHCFTCTKDVKAAYFTSRTLAAEGIAVLRFDFAGLGQSGGDFSRSSFSSNISDLRAAATYLRQNHRPPSLLVGHSLGGTAVLTAAREIPEAAAVVTIASPLDPAHLRRHIDRDQSSKTAPDDDTVEIVVSGRRFRLGSQFFFDLEKHDVGGDVAELDRALLVCHAPDDAVVNIAEAYRIFNAAAEPKSFLSLPGAGHLVAGRDDGDYLGRTIAAWARRYLLR